MALFDIFKKQEADEGPRTPYALNTSLTPYRLNANKKESITVTIRVKNLTKDPLLTSVDMEVPTALSFDEMGMVRRKSFRLGSIEPGKEKEFKGEYTVAITATAHFRDYEHVVNIVKTTHKIGVI
jgi:hypothetical protein